ncbi:hypothetical protein F2Q70_00025294 [Brassica cretica]|uniref:Uncharacterized protein n=1 Tax=Brassica cretica TaxID=69181 RepID=A0A8S9L221_BRACR|nr:hypothetical protein F2Q70_00025294 [Brassica cretica]
MLLLRFWDAKYIKPGGELMEINMLLIYDKSVLEEAVGLEKDDEGTKGDRTNEESQFNGMAVS